MQVQAEAGEQALAGSPRIGARQGREKEARCQVQCAVPGADSNGSGSGSTDLSSPDRPDALKGKTLSQKTALSVIISWRVCGFQKHHPL